MGRVSLIHSLGSDQFFAGFAVILFCQDVIFQPQFEVAGGFKIVDLPAVRLVFIEALGGKQGLFRLGDCQQGVAFELVEGLFGLGLRQLPGGQFGLDGFNANQAGQHVASDDFVARAGQYFGNQSALGEGQFDRGCGPQRPFGGDDVGLSLRRGEGDFGWTGVAVPAQAVSRRVKRTRGRVSFFMVGSFVVFICSLVVKGWVSIQTP